MSNAAEKPWDYSLEAPHTNPPAPIASQRKPQKRSWAAVIQSKVFIGVVVVCLTLVTLLCIGLVKTYEADNDITHTIDAWNDKLSAEQLFWFNDGLQELRGALGQTQNKKRAKNVILFVADGMGPATVTAARIYKAKEEGHLIWERFPQMGLLKVSTGSRIKNCSIVSTYSPRFAHRRTVQTNKFPTPNVRPLPCSAV